MSVGNTKLFFHLHDITMNIKKNVNQMDYYTYLYDIKKQLILEYILLQILRIDEDLLIEKYNYIEQQK